MKRKIEDYKKQKIAIYCSSKEEWDKVNDFLGKKGLTRTYGAISESDNMFVDCIHINGKGTANEFWYKKEGYTIYPASDFLEEEPKFDEGKWYKNIGKDDKAYAKCKKFEKNCFYLSDHISKDKQYRLYTDGSYFSEKNYQNAELLTDLSEIQQYLPEGHPDKVKPFKFNIGDEVKTKAGGCYICEPESWKKEIHEITFPSETYGSFGTIKNRKNCQGLNWYSLGDGYNWITEEGVELVKEDYVEYIDTKYKGQIVKVEEWTNHSFCCIRFENGQREQPFKNLVKPSTKEAYEAQNKPKQLAGNNLLPNKIYVTDDPTDYIFKTSETSKGYSHYICKFKCFRSILNKDYIWGGNLRLATKEEEKWLNTCILQNKFIPKEDLHLYDDSGLLIQKENMEEIVEEANGFYIPIQNGKLLSQSIKKGFRKALPNEIPITSECIMYNGEIFEIKESFKTEIYDFGDIYIAPVIKKTKKLQTITIESTTDLNLNLTKIKSKQIQTIKI